MLRNENFVVENKKRVRVTVTQTHNEIKLERREDSIT
jgi:hypothetical protein